MLVVKVGFCKPYSGFSKSLPYPSALQLISKLQKSVSLDKILYLGGWTLRHCTSLWFLPSPRLHPQISRIWAWQPYPLSPLVVRGDLATQLLKHTTQQCLQSESWFEHELPSCLEERDHLYNFILTKLRAGIEQ